MRRAVVAALGGAAAWLALCAAPSPARAQISTDGALLAQMIAQEQQAVTQLEQILQALKGQTQLVSQILSGEALQDVGLALGLLQSTYQNYQTILSDLKSVGYTMTSVNLNFAATFPSAGAYQGMSQTGYPAVEYGWSNEMLASAQIADRAQVSLTETQELTDLATNIIQESGSAPGEVAELQLIVQMLGVVQSNMTMLVQNLTTTGRALVDSVAVAASEREMSADRRRRNRLNYTFRGAAVNVPNQLP